jgi:uncharacterized protein (TIGR03083 family)
MTLSRSEVTPGLIDELDAFATLLGSLSAEDWSRPTRCAGWSVGDVAAHVVGSMADVVNGRLDGLGSDEATAREVAEREGRSAADLIQELAEVTKLASDVAAGFDDAAWEAPAPSDFPGTLGQGVEALWYDTYLHADDIRAALGRPSVRGDGLRASVHHVAFELERLGWGPATLALDGIERVPVGGGGTLQTGDALEFVLIATGRADRAELGPDAPINIYG